MSEVADSTQEFPVQSYAMGTALYARRDERILILKRAVGAMAGSWYLPGGGVDPGETLEACATRELYEETALRPLGPLVLIGLVPMHIYGRDMLIVGYACECADGEVVLSAAHSDHRWVDPRQFREESFSEENVRRIEMANSRVGAIVRGIQRDLDRYLAWCSSEQELARLREAVRVV
jgi:8-oxo-dGTP pyrophosphatase MutT (NUDIX family)